MKRVQVSVPLPAFLYDWLRDRKHRKEAGIRNIVSDRDIEYGFIASRIPDGTGRRALDLGFSCNMIAAALLQRGFDVTAIDLMERPWSSFDAARFQFIQDDFLTHRFEPGSFSLIVNCSTVEHIGLSGRYGTKSAETDGDLTAMQRAHALLPPDGRMLLTIPVGRDTVFAPYHRGYGEERLPRLLENYRVASERFWRKNSENKWCACDRAEALAEPPEWHAPQTTCVYYALGCFELLP